MILDLSDTSSREIASALIKARRTVGSASGLVLTLLIVTKKLFLLEYQQSANRLVPVGHD